MMLNMPALISDLVGIVDILKSNREFKNSKSWRTKGSMYKGKRRSIKARLQIGFKCLTEPVLVNNYNTCIQKT